MNNVLFSSSSDSWSTPDDLFNFLDSRYHFDLDVCASAENHKCKLYFSKEQDAFNQVWFGNVWCNPPYSRHMYEWISACCSYADRTRNVVGLLVPARTDVKWFHDLIYPRSCLCFPCKLSVCAVCFIKGRLHFGGCCNSAPFPSMLVLFNSDLGDGFWTLDRDFNFI